MPKISFKKAIETAVSQGILSDYLDRKSREVINMLCAKYDYKMDIAVKQEEAYEDGKRDGMSAGMIAGIEKGAHDNAVENAKSLLREGDSVEKVSRCIGLPLEEVQKLSSELE